MNRINTSEMGRFQSSVEKEGALPEEVKFNFKKIFLVFGLIAAFIGAGIFLGYSYKPKKFFFKPNTKEIYYNLKELTLNLGDVRENHYIKVEISLAFTTKSMQKELDNKNPEVRDTIIRIISTKKAAQIDEPAEIEALKQEIVNKVNDLLEKGRLTNVYFTEFIIQ